MLEVIKSLMPLLLASFFLYAGASSAATAILHKKERKVQLSLAGLFTTFALFLWVLSMADFLGLMGNVIVNKAWGMFISICIMFLIVGVMTAGSYIYQKRNT